MVLAYGKISIQGKLRVKTGLHIGASSAFAAIGATDSPIIKDPLTNLPIVPGSSIKGKMRSLLAKVYNQKVANNPNEDDDRIQRLFGASNSQSEGQRIKVGRLIFRDCILANEDELRARGVHALTEVKFENTIDRRSAMANPRQIERAIVGSEFGFELIYTLDNVVDMTELKEDIKLIRNGLNLLELDYLGGHGSRGSGRVAFEDLQATVVFGELEQDVLSELNQQLQMAE